ncbi:MAG: TonB-dependent receptor [Alphaproteobacteria bacterium]|nr:TonB-dependent receptor [Alphaproteobacteria bacterium]
MTRPASLSVSLALLASAALTAGSGVAIAQQPASVPDVVVVVGSRIAGAEATDALPVTVIGPDEIDAIAAASGDDLFRAIPQLGDVAFNTTRTIGGVNDARGDTASINLRALGTGNTLVLLNGRRMVNHPGTQAENLVPVVSVNTNAIPVMGVGRVEVLLDGASAIYGADAVAGVVDTRLKSGFEGFTAELMLGQEEGIDAAEASAAFEFGINADEDRTNLSIFGSWWGRDPIFASERDFSRTADLRRLLPADWAGQSQFDNTSITSPWGGFDRVTPGNITVGGVAVTNAAGQFHIQPNTLPGCLSQLSGGVCIDDTSTRDAVLRYDVNEGVTVQNGVDRFNGYTTFSHEFAGGLELFTEAGGYLAESLGFREPAPLLAAAPIVIPRTNFWNPFGPVGSPSRYAVTNAPAAGLDISLVGYRPVDAGLRRIEVENLSTRFLAGLRGDAAGYDWEGALLYSDAHTEDATRNAVSNTLFQQSLALATPDAYNPFSGGSLGAFSLGDAAPSPRAALDAISIDVYRRNRTTLGLADIRVSRPDLLRLWAGEIGLAAGAEFRRETFRDDRDPRLDGTIAFLDPISGVRSSDVMGSSATNDTKGARTVRSAFLELAIPLVSPGMDIPLVRSLDLQLAARHEDFDRFGGVTAPKAALSWRPFDFLLLRSSWSEGFRAPNLQQLFETGLQRSNVRTDWARCEIDARNGGAGPTLVSGNTCGAYSASVVSNRAGSLALEPERSENLSAGLVIESTFLPSAYGEISLTLDAWRIDQRDIVGIFGDDNQILYDYYLRTIGASNPAVVRAAPDAQDMADAAGTGLAPAGDILFVNDNYLNLFPRRVEGIDLGLSYAIDDTPLGDFDVRFNAAWLETFYQQPSPEAQAILDARAAGSIAAAIVVEGAESLIRQFGRPELRWTSSLTWRRGALGAGWFAGHVGDVEDAFIRRASDNAIWRIDSLTTHNVYVQYTFGRETDRPARLRLGARNLTDETPPLADTNYGYLGDIHSAAGRLLYVSLRKEF